MEHTPRSVFDLRFLLVALICVSGSATGAYFLYKDLNAKGGAGVGAPMAKVERLEQKVRRKAGSSYIWANVDENEDLYKKDSIQTGPGSAATVKFNDGSMIEVGENSLVVIDDIQNLQLNFKRGSLIIRRSDGTDSKVTVDKDGKTKVEELPIRLMNPAPLTNYYVPERATKSVKFSWEPRGKTPVEGFIVQVAPDKSFKQAKVVTLQGAEIRETELQLTPGRYFWRVMGKGAQPSEPRALRISTAFGLKATFPNSKQRVLSWGGDSTIQFRWQIPQSKTENVAESIESGKHEIQIASDGEFRSIVLSQSIAPETGIANLKGVGEGNLFWRVKSRYGDVEATGEIERFTVEKAKELALELGRPDKNSSFEARPQVVFTWNSDATNVEYQWELTDASGKALLNNKGRAQAYAWVKPGPGTYKWRVTAVWNGQRVGQTEWRQFSIFQGKPVALKSPAKNQEIFYWDEPLKFNFEWTKDSMADTDEFAYQLDVARDTEFKQPLHSKKTEDLSISSRDVGTFAPGSYFWRIRLVDKAGQTIKTSEVAKFAYGVHPTIKPPVEAKPGPGVEFNPLEEQHPTLTWAPVEGAEDYEVIVYAPVPAKGRTPASNKVYFRTTTSKTSATVKDLTEGKYFWTIKSIDKLKRTGEPMPPKWFNITYGEPLGAPESTTPEVQ